MDKTMTRLLGAVGALAAAGSAPVCAHAASSVAVPAAAPMQATSYADLLRPVPNALAVLRAPHRADAEAAALAGDAAPEATLQEAQLVVIQPHHHHHHRYYRRRYYHHHHHRYFRHHHHHHHHNSD